MGTARLILGDVAREVPLSTSTRFGRHWSSDAPIEHPGVPLHWIELRWRDDHWAWRPLGALERSRGTGSVDAAGFRAWPKGVGHVRLDGDVHVEVRLVDAGPPGWILEDVRTRARLVQPEIERYLEIWHDGRAWPLGSEPDPAHPLADGAIIVQEQQVWRLHRPGGVADTAAASMDATDPALALSIDVPQLHAAFCARGRDAEVRGECVRVLAVYALARRNDADGGGDGWIGAPAAHDAWIALGGRASSSIDRLAWERGKLRNRLAAQGVGGLDGLFRARGAGMNTEIQLALEPRQLEVALP